GRPGRDAPLAIVQAAGAGVAVDADRCANGALVRRGSGALATAARAGRRLRFVPSIAERARLRAVRTRRRRPTRFPALSAFAGTGFARKTGVSVSRSARSGADSTPEATFPPDRRLIRLARRSTGAREPHPIGPLSAERRC